MDNCHTISVTFTADEAGMLRIMGLIHRRGFEVQGVDMPVSFGPMRTARITVSPKGPAFRIDILARQLERLHEVKSVSTEAARGQSKILSFFKKRPAETVSRV